MENIKNTFLEKTKTVNNIDDLRILKADFLGKKSEINNLMKNLANLSIEEKKSLGTEINNLKQFITEELNKIEEKQEIGYIHPMVKVQKELQDILYSMGFSITSGSEIENDWNCFEGLNIPKHHPARQMQDTFYLKNEENNAILLRTQTSAMEIREMTAKKPPFKFICTGKVFRSEMDSTHSPMFHQLEGVFVDEGITIQDLKNCLITILKKFFNLKTVPLRFRPSYFPFTSPSIEVDIKYKKVDGKIILGEGEDWIEILGCGMLHPQVLKNVGINSNKYTGFAFGFGIERMAMLKYGIRDIRNLYDGDIRFLRQYGFKIYEK